MLSTFEWCAFDAAGNFFANGTALSGGQKIANLKVANVNLPAQTMHDPGLGIGTYWMGMYVARGTTRLSVGGNYEIQNFKSLAACRSPPG